MLLENKTGSMTASIAMIDHYVAARNERRGEVYCTAWRNVDASGERQRKDPQIGSALHMACIVFKEHANAFLAHLSCILFFSRMALYWGL
jgi:hypothetical protein